MHITVPIGFETNKECVICFEMVTESNRTIPYILNTHFSTTKAACACDAIIHVDCLRKWKAQSNSCPICSSKYSHKIHFVNIYNECINDVSTHCLKYIKFYLLALLSALCTSLILCVFAKIRSK